MPKLTISVSPESGAFERLFAIVNGTDEWIRTLGTAGETTKQVAADAAEVEIGAFGVPGSKYKATLSWGGCSFEKSYTLATESHSVLLWASDIHELKARP